MEFKLAEKDYVPDGLGGFERVTGAREILERALFKLTARRGGFPLLPELGSRLYLLSREKPGNRLSAAKTYAAEALSDETELSLADLSIEDADGGAISLTVYLGYEGETLALSINV